HPGQAGRWRSHQAELYGSHRGLCAIAYAQLVQDVLDVCFDGAAADAQVVRNLAIGVALYKKPQDVVLAGGELGRSGGYVIGANQAPEQPDSQVRVDDRLAR